MPRSPRRPPSTAQHKSKAAAEDVFPSPTLSVRRIGSCGQPYHEPNSFRHCNTRTASCILIVRQRSHVMHLLSTPFVIAVILLVVLAVISAFFRQPAGVPRANGKQAYEAVPALLTPAERSFFGVLRQAVGSDYHLFAKVRLADIVRPVRSPSRSGRQLAFNRITGKHVVFVLCDMERLRIVGVIELDDSSHATFERGFRDALVDSALADAGIPVLRVPARQSLLAGADS